MNFPQALDAMQRGGCVSFTEGTSICLQQPSPESGMTKPYFTQQTGDGHIVPWSPTQAEILGTAWRVVKANIARAAIAVGNAARGRAIGGTPKARAKTAAGARAKAPAGKRQLQPA